MKSAVISACVLLAAIPSFCAQVAVFTPSQSVGIELLTSGDGRWEKKVVDGIEAAALIEQSSPPNYYLYFGLTPEVRQKIGSEFWIVVDFHDDGIGIARVQYNSAIMPYEKGPGLVLADSGKWERALLHVTGAQLRGLQNAGADFRLSRTGPLTISRLEVHTSEPQLAIISQEERMKSSFKSLPKPRDMYYTFGSDADEATAQLFRMLGVTSVESYVTWETCERAGEGRWDWSQWDRQVEILKKNDLKWVPFLILGPAYSTPDWFRASDQHFPCVCLEHGTASKIESLWNPNLPKWIDRFISEFAKRYRDSGVIESVLLGIQGDFGEAIYSVFGGGWTSAIPGEYHNHPGYWCNDPYALADFRKFISQRYRSIDRVNKAWGSNFVDFDSVDFPYRGDDKAFRDRMKSGDAGASRQWLDFIEWYRASMTRWSEWWIATTRKHFPETPIYLCTGGDACPPHGSNFAEQCRVAAKHNAGVRITNEASNYPNNFVLTRWVASAGKHYGAYYGFEPAGLEDVRGIVARIYNATASGANQLHDYSANVTKSRETIDVQTENLKWLFHVSKPVVPVAVWYPETAMTLDWGGFLGEKAAPIRDYVDFDFVDETMLRSGALDHYKVLLIVHGSVMETRDSQRIAGWIEKGGTALVTGVSQFVSVEGDDSPERELFGTAAQGRKIGSGQISRHSDLAQMMDALRAICAERDLAVCDFKPDGVFCTQINDNEFLYLNTTDKPVTVQVECGGKSANAEVQGNSIMRVNL